jgi:uncharacterized coiled-coil DUF342 family protein
MPEKATKTTTEVTAKIRNLVEAREKISSAIDELKRKRTTRQDSVQALADEIATRDFNFDGLVSRHKEALAFEEEEFVEPRQSRLSKFFKRTFIQETRCLRKKLFR